MVDAYFSATKIKWILDHVPGVRERARRGEVLFGTVDTLACLEAHRRKGPCHGLYQRLPHHAV